MIEQLIAFTVAAAIVIVVPGPDMMLLLRNTARGGHTGARWTAAGIMTGLAVLGTAAAVGLTAVLTASSTAFTIVRIAGGVYLVYLGVQAVISYRRMRARPADAGPHRIAGPVADPAVRSSSFRQGLFSNLLNPKVAAFYLSLFPQFDLAPLAPIAQHAVLAGLFWLFCLIWYVVVVATIGRVAAVFRSPAFARRTEAVAGVTLVGLGGVVLAHSG